MKCSIKLKSFNYKILEMITKFCLDEGKTLNLDKMSVIRLPKKIKKFSVIRSPHVHKKSREQFQIKVHLRIIDLLNTSSKTVDSLMKLDLPAGVDIEIKT